MVDSNGYVLPSKNNFKNIDLPILANISDLESTMNFGEKSTSKVINKAVSWLSYIKKYHSYLYKNISELKVSSSDELEIILSDYPTKIFLGQKKVKSRINSLLKFKEKLKTNKITDYNYLDLRYDNQIIAMERSLMNPISNINDTSITVGLDIGSRSIKCAIGEIKPDNNNVKLLGVSETGIGWYKKRCNY